MKIRWNATFISALLLSVCLVSFIPGGLRFASTWRDVYFQGPGYWQQNLLMPLGFDALAFAIIGLIILWTGYRKNELWAWFAMLAMLMCFVFPHNLLPPLLINRQSGSGIRWSYWFGMSWWGDPLAMGFGLGVLTFLMMLVALVLPMKAFFRRSNG